MITFVQLYTLPGRQNFLILDSFCPVINVFYEQNHYRTGAGNTIPEQAYAIRKAGIPGGIW